LQKEYVGFESFSGLLPQTQMPRYSQFSGKFIKNCHRNEEKLGSYTTAAKYLRLIATDATLALLRRQNRIFFTKD